MEVMQAGQVGMLSCAGSYRVLSGLKSALACHMHDINLEAKLEQVKLGNGAWRIDHLHDIRRLLHLGPFLEKGHAIGWHGYLR